MNLNQSQLFLSVTCFRTRLRSRTRSNQSRKPAPIFGVENRSRFCMTHVPKVGSDSQLVGSRLWAALSRAGFYAEPIVCGSWLLSFQFWTRSTWSPKKKTLHRKCYISRTRTKTETIQQTQVTWTAWAKHELQNENNTGLCASTVRVYSGVA